MSPCFCMRDALAFVTGHWLQIPYWARWALCWPLLAIIYLSFFPLADLAVNLTLQVALGMPSQHAIFVAPVLSDMVHMAVVLPSIRLLVPSRQYLVIFDFAFIVFLVTILTVIEIWQTERPALPDEYTSRHRLINCLVVLTITSWYGWRLRRAASRA